MSEKPEASEPVSAPPEEVIRNLMAELGTAFDLSTSLGDQRLGEAVERRLRSLEREDTPEWGTEGSLTQVAHSSSRALDFYYRPHLFPDMDPALRLGHRLQFDLLPRRLPETSPLHIAAVLESYCHLSGDLLGWRAEGDELLLWIADVSGHGVRAGLAGATLYFLIRSLEPGLPPAELARRLNERMLAAKNPDDPKTLFATAIWLRVRADGSLRYASCGHHPMLVLRSSGRVETLEATGRPLGLLPGQSFDETSLKLDTGDVACLFTDGLVEARNPAGEDFGIHRLADLLREAKGSRIERTRAIYEAVGEHRTTSLLDDDLTFLVLEPTAL